MDITVFAESASGRKINAIGFINLPVETGDLSPPAITTSDTIPAQVLVDDTVSLKFDVLDPSVARELQSTLSVVVLVASFNNGELVITEIQDGNQDGEYIIEFDTSTAGKYEFLIAAIDVAGNIEFLSSSNSELFSFQINEVQSSSTTTSTTASTSTDTETADYFSGSILVLGILGLFTRKKRKIKQ